MTLTDLYDTPYHFTRKDCWLIATHRSDSYLHDLTNDDIRQLRDNCKRILAATDSITNQGGY